MRYLAYIVTAAWSILVGLKVTLVNFFRPTVTVQYPYRRLPVPKGFRGLPVLITDPDTGRPRCTGCGVCARNCPLGLIAVEETRDADNRKVMASFRLDLSRCMICNLCVEACAFDALGMGEAFELAEYDPERLVYDQDRLLAMGRNFRWARVGGHGGTRL